MDKEIANIYRNFGFIKGVLLGCKGSYPEIEKTITEAIEKLDEIFKRMDKLDNGRGEDE